MMRIGSDALRTAEAITGEALEPALAAAGLPAGSLSLVRSADRAAGWALFDDRRLALAGRQGLGSGHQPARGGRPSSGHPR